MVKALPSETPQVPILWVLHAQRFLGTARATSPCPQIPDLSLAFWIACIRTRQGGMSTRLKHIEFRGERVAFIRAGEKFATNQNAANLIGR